MSVPTLLVWGARDRLIPSTTAGSWLHALENAQLHVIADAGHVPMVETPGELVAAINEFRGE